MPMNAHSTVMTVMPMQIVKTHQDHLLASVTITLTTMAMEKPVMLTVSFTIVPLMISEMNVSLLV